ncbi:MAG TPA: exodeoxyribonuclease VII large subunit [Anaerolineales bacterium]|nr:exodeoxyribonuclease VII large subunit [Anaerolineales bacterium]
MAQLSFSGYAPRTWKISDLVRYLRQMVETDFRLQDLWATGEVSNLSRPASGHLYFTLKDAEASLRCVMWRSEALRQRYLPRDGETVEVHGHIGVFESAGLVQLYADTLRPTGEGELYQNFLRLKARLEAEGLFEASRKRPLPPRPGRIGIVTSPAAAALRDVLHVLRRRFPLAEVVLAAAPVQGPEAPQGIAAALRALDRYARPDVILLVRGGGSLEDLAPFNSEEIARAVAASEVPVVSGVGHETDFTIADFVADVRAPTPSVAAELVTPDRLELAETVADARRRLQQGAVLRLRGHQDHLRQARLGLAGAAPRARLANARQRIDELGLRATHAIRSQLALRVAAVRGLGQTLRAVGPPAVLARGYAVVQQTSTGSIVRSVGQVRPGEALDIRVADGTFPAAAGVPQKG